MVRTRQTARPIEKKRDRISFEAESGLTLAKRYKDDATAEREAACRVLNVDRAQMLPVADRLKAASTAISNLLQLPAAGFCDSLRAAKEVADTAAAVIDSTPEVRVFGG